MRNFLKDLYIVGAVQVFREGKLIRYGINDLMKYCDHIVILIDNEDKRTRDIALRYKRKYKDYFTICWSGVPRSVKEKEKKPGHIKHRAKHTKNYSKGVVLYELRKLNKKRKIDILIFHDADEMFTDHFPKVLEKFWESNKSALAVRLVQPFDDFYTIYEHRAFPHFRIFKYRDDMRAFPTRFRQLFFPFTSRDAMGHNYSMIHLGSFTEEMRQLHKRWTGREPNPEYRLWKTDKDIRKMSPEEIGKVLKSPHFLTRREYYERKKLSN